ncbi:hypothetical protein ACFL96_18225 [Thermoproteota archaeon]
MKIEYQGVQLSKIFPTFLESLEVIYTLHDLKRVTRICCEYGQIESIKKFCEDNGLFLSCNYKLIHVVDLNKGFSNRCKFMPLDATKQGKPVIFISKNKELCDLAANPTLRESLELGIILEYPRCCAVHYMKNFNKASEKQMDFVLLTGGDKLTYPFYNNICLRPFGISLISHFPCSFDCKKSEEIAMKRLKLLRKGYPAIAQKFEKELKSFVVYSEYEGVHYTSEYLLESGKISFRSLISTADTRLRKALLEAGSVTAENSSLFSIDGKDLKPENTGLFVFE